MWHCKCNASSSAEKVQHSSRNALRGTERSVRLRDTLRVEYIIRKEAYCQSLGHMTCYELHQVASFGMP